MFKKLISFFAMLLMVVLMAAVSETSAQISDDVVRSTGDLYTTDMLITGTIDGTDTLYTSSFSLMGHNDVFTFARYYAQTNDSVKVKVVRQSSFFDGLWTTSKTVTEDSVETQLIVADTASTYAAFRYAILGVTGNGYNVAFTMKVRAKRD